MLFFAGQVTATFEGIDYPNPTYSYVNGLITPGQKGYFGNWTKHDNSDLAMVYHYGGPVKVRRRATFRTLRFWSEAMPSEKNAHIRNLSHLRDG